MYRYLKAQLRGLRWLLNGILAPFDQEVVNRGRLLDYRLRAYESYEQYRQVQTQANKRKIERVWADERTLSALCDELREAMPDQAGLRGICHGTRNGFEQRFMAEYGGFDVIGTEISDTADQFERTVQWDFHDVKEDWVGKFDFVYSNALDHAYNPSLAVETWLNQLNSTGLLALEFTETNGPWATSDTDPFGVRPTAVPFVLCEWFGHDVSMRCVRGVKSNTGVDVWLYLVRKNRADVSAQTTGAH